MITFKKDTNLLDALQTALPGQTAAMLDKIALRVERTAKVIATDLDVKDTGQLINSIQVEESGPLSRRIGPSVDYAIDQELGTKYIAARPFLRPALEAETQDLATDAAGMLEDATK